MQAVEVERDGLGALFVGEGEAGHVATGGVVGDGCRFGFPVADREYFASVGVMQGDVLFDVLGGELVLAWPWERELLVVVDGDGCCVSVWAGDRDFGGEERRGGGAVHRG